MKTIRSLIKNGLLISLGTMALTKEKAEKIVKELTKNQKISSVEGKKLVNELLAQSKKQGQKLKGVVNNEVQQVMEKIGVATKKDLQALEKKINAFNKKKKKK